MGIQVRSNNHIAVIVMRQRRRKIKLPFLNENCHRRRKRTIINTAVKNEDELISFITDYREN
jgi:hypothetical protein